ncbi:MAG: gamma-glutamyltransferase family protein [SAR202 cluster bacterium]|nr:gamma-glutamyltransferase family protein [SAR202 cluster bacterium]MDP6664050.1 gamma-glutamyltransferase family protein [SAR202 cluster bacterium]
MSTPTTTTFTKTEARASGGMVATKDVSATQAGLEMLRLGGNAVDAAVAACFAVGVVEPYYSGIGGGGYLVYQVGEKGGVFGFPMRGPLAAKPDMYELTGEDSVGGFGWAGVTNDENIEGYRSIATPGAVSGLCMARERLGKLPLAEVVAPAVRLARDGFTPGWYNLHATGNLAGMLVKYDELRRVLMPGGAMPVGRGLNRANLRQPELANILEAIGRDGPDAFYKGDFAKALVSDIQANGGILSERDLAEYKPFVWDRGLEFGYRGLTIRVPPFACAGITSAMTLKLLEGFDVSSMGHNSVDTLHAYISSARLAYADRFEYLADPEFADVPWNGLLSDDYTARRQQEIDTANLGRIGPGDPWREEGRQPTSRLVASAPAINDGTTHLCAMDSDGNAVSLTNTVMSGFGSGIIPKGTGVVMNNGMMWYDPVPGRVNSIMPGKFPLNNMTPMIAMDGDGVKLAVGASGGRMITNCVTQLLVKIMDFGMGPQAAIDSPRVDCSLPQTLIDPRLDAEVVAGLEARGHRLHAISGEFQAGFTTFASPVAILRESPDSFRAGVDTFHSAYAEGV